MASKKVPLGEAIRKALTESGGTVSGLARDLGVHRPTLAAWLTKNAFPQELIPKIASAVDLPSDEGELRRSFEYGTTQWTWAGVGKQREPREEETELEVMELLLSQAESGDVFCHFFCDALPEEWMEPLRGRSDGPLSRVVKAAVDRGVKAVYLTLTDDLRAEWQRRFSVTAPSEIEGIFRQWAAGVERGKPGKLAMRRSKALPLFVPGIRMLGVIRADKGQRSLRHGALLVLSNATDAIGNRRAASAPLPPGIVRLMESEPDLS